ncbi:MAG TPA: OstA-like protein [Rhodothermales bacterium]|nr:OstA-like protein [Rhodothermales bacterium]
MRSRLAWFCLLFVVVAISARTVQAQVESDTTRSNQADVSADSLTVRTENGEEIQDLMGHVFVRQDSTMLRSQRAIRYVNGQTYVFSGNVLIVERGDSLRADTVYYDRRTKIGRARGNVLLTDGEVEVRAPSGSYFSREKRARFEEGLTLVDSTSEVTSERGTYWSDEKRAELDGNVRLNADRTHLESDSLTYFRETEVSIARSNVFIERIGGADDADADSTIRTLLFGQYAYNDDRAGRSQVEGQPLLVQLRQDSTGAEIDTLMIRALMLESVQQDSLQRLVAVDSVQIWKADFAALADSVVYERMEMARDTLASDSTLTAFPASDSTMADSTLIDFTATDSAVSDSIVTDTTMIQREETRLFGNPVAWVEESQVSGDSIRVKGRGGEIDSLFVRRNAFVAQRDTVLDRIQQLKGQHLVGVFLDDSVRVFTLGPNAEVIYFQRDDNDQPDGGLKASGDKAVFYIRGDQPERIAFSQDIQGTMYPESQLPTPFRLDGFRWEPERRPTSVDLVREDRIRRILQGLPPIMIFETVPSATKEDEATAENSDSNN